VQRRQLRRGRAVVEPSGTVTSGCSIPGKAFPSRPQTTSAASAKKARKICLGSKESSPSCVVQKLHLASSASIRKRLVPEHRSDKKKAIGDIALLHLDGAGTISSSSVWMSSTIKWFQADLFSSTITVTGKAPEKSRRRISGGPRYSSNFHRSTPPRCSSDRSSYALLAPRWSPASAPAF